MLTANPHLSRILSRGGKLAIYFEIADDLVKPYTTKQEGMLISDELWLRYDEPNQHADAVQLAANQPLGTNRCKTRQHCGMPLMQMQVRERQSCSGDC